MYNISNIMTEEIFLVLMASIPHSLVSAFNTPEISAYNFEFYIDQQFFSVDLLVSYANTTPENIYVKYELILNKTLLEKQYYPILKTNKKSISKKAKQMKTLLEMCSRQVIAQELQSRKMHMLKTFSTNQQNTYN